MRCAILLCLLCAITGPSAAAELFTIWPGHPRSPTLPGSEDGRISRQWAVEVDLRGIVANQAALEQIEVRLPEGITRFAMRHVDLVSGFVLDGEDDFRIDPDARDSDITYTWYGESGDRQLSIAAYHGIMSATQTGPGAPTASPTWQASCAGGMSTHDACLAPSNNPVRSNRSPSTSDTRRRWPARSTA